MFSSKSKWIGCGKNFSAPILIKKFHVSEPVRAVIDVCGLGYYELFVNGKRVGEDFFKPAVSDYSPRDFSDFLYPLPDQTSHRIYYNTWEIGRYLQAGENTLAIMLGNGFYRQTKRTCEGNTLFNDELIARFELRLFEQVERRVVSDGSVRVKESFIRENNLFFGETHDYRFFEDAFFNEGEACAHVVLPPKGKLLKQKSPNDRVIEELEPKLIARKGNKRLYDAGQNLSGFVRMKALSKVVRIFHAEELAGDTLDYASAGGAEQIYECVYENAQERTVHPWFSWGGFRYFEIEGEAEEVRVCIVHAAVKVTASFECGNETLNWLYQAFVQSMLSNMHGGVPSDCPHRERLGYTGDGLATAESAMLTLNARRFYEKWIADIADCQDVQSGHVQHTAPFFGGGGGPGGWGGAMVLVPYAYYRAYGDRAILKRYYPNMLAYLRSMDGFAENGLIVKEREKGWCLGEWCTPERVTIPAAFVNTFYYIRCMETVEEIAVLIGEQVDLQENIATAKAAMEQAFFDRATGDYCGGKQGANAFALSLGLGDERTKDNLLRFYRTEKRLNTGIFGTKILSEYLSSIGEKQLLFDLLSAEGYPSFEYMKKAGATTLWESWNGDGSHNHHMFGGCVKELFHTFLGMSADAGFKHISLSPVYIEGMGFLRAKLQFPKGSLWVEYRFQDGKVYPKIRKTGAICVQIKGNEI